MGSNRPIINWIFQNTVTSTGNGNELIIYSGMVTASISITGTATTRQCIFEGKDLDGNWYAIQCVNLTTMSLASQTTGINEIWQASLEGFTSFRVRIANISGGNITVKAKVVD